MNTVYRYGISILYVNREFTVHIIGLYEYDVTCINIPYVYNKPLLGIHHHSPPLIPTEATALSASTTTAVPYEAQTGPKRGPNGTVDAVVLSPWGGDFFGMGF